MLDPIYADLATNSVPQDVPVFIQDVMDQEFIFYCGSVEEVRDFNGLLVHRMIFLYGSIYLFKPREAKDWLCRMVDTLKRHNIIVALPASRTSFLNDGKVVRYATPDEYTELSMLALLT